MKTEHPEETESWEPRTKGKSRIMYIEDKSEGLTGPARIGRVTFSKTGKSIYYRNHFAPADFLPANLISLAGKAGISICISHYPSVESRWRFVEDEDDTDSEDEEDDG